MTEITRRAVVLAALTGGITMGIISDAGRNPGDLSHRIVELERQVRDLQTASRLESASIGAGGVRVRGGRIVIQDRQGNDAMVLATDGLTLSGVLRVLDDGHDRVILGELPSGGHGLAVVDDDGNAVELASLAFGIRSVTVDVAESTDSDQFGDLATVGPVVPGVPIGPTGRALVTMSARIQPNANNVARMGVAITGATQRDPVTNETLGAGALADSIDLAASRTVLVEGLSPGEHTFTAKYASVNLATAFFGARNLTVQPF